MNNENFMKWVTTQLLPNLPEKSVLVLDNAAYHNVTVEKNVTSSSRKQEMLDWLTKHNIPCNSSMTKVELYDLVKTHRPAIPPKYKLDELLESHGHTVLRLPPYHPELNPIEKIWANVKNFVASHNTTFQLDDVEKLARQRFEQLGAETWKPICDHVKEVEQKMMSHEFAIDTITDQSDLNFVVNGSSEDETDCLSEESGVEELD